MWKVIIRLSKCNHRPWHTALHCNNKPKNYKIKWWTVKKLTYKYYQANKQIGHTVLTNDKVSGNDEWTLHSERSTIESEDSSTPCEATIVQCKYKTRTETEVRRTTENNSAVVALKHKQQRAPYLAFIYYTSLTTHKSILLACQMLSRVYTHTHMHTHMHTCTHTHPFNGPSSGTIQVSRYQKGKTNLDLLKQETVSGSGISWAICKSAPCSRQITYMCVCVCVCI